METFILIALLSVIAVGLAYGKWLASGLIERLPSAEQQRIEGFLLRYSAD